jgi:hypothetical protein
MTRPAFIVAELTFVRIVMAIAAKFRLQPFEYSCCKCGVFWPRLMALSAFCALVFAFQMVFGIPVVLEL